MTRHDVLVSFMESHPEYREWHSMTEILNGLAEEGIIHAGRYTDSSAVGSDRCKYGKTVNQDVKYGFFEREPYPDARYPSMHRYRYVGRD